MESLGEKVFRLIPELRIMVLTELWIQKFTGMSTQYMLDTFHKKGRVVTIMKPRITVNFMPAVPSFRILPPLSGCLHQKCLMLTDTGEWRSCTV